jgi:hypothetical protein
MIPGVPEYAVPFFWPSLLGTGTDSSREKSSPRPVTTGAPAPTSTQGSKRAVEAFRWACRVLDAGGR